MSETVTEYLTNSTDLKTVADAIRGRTGGTGNLTYPSGFASAIAGIGTFQSNAAGAGDIRNGKKAYANGSTLTGTMTEKSAETYNTSTSDQIIASGQYLGGSQTIKAVTTSNISADNIKKGVVVKVGDANSAGRIKNVTGTCVPCSLTLAESTECYVPFMMKATDANTLGIYRGSGGFFISAGGASSKPFIVPCNIKMTFYATDTASSTTTLTFYTGTVYTLAPYTNTVALINGGGYNTTVWKIVKWEVA